MTRRQTKYNANTGPNDSVSAEPKRRNRRPPLPHTYAPDQRYQTTGIHGRYSAPRTQQQPPANMPSTPYNAPNMDRVPSMTPLLPSGYSHPPPAPGLLSDVQRMGLVHGQSMHLAGTPRPFAYPPVFDQPSPPGPLNFPSDPDFLEHAWTHQSMNSLPYGGSAFTEYSSMSAAERLSIERYRSIGPQQTYNPPKFDATIPERPYTPEMQNGTRFQGSRYSQLRGDAPVFVPRAEEKRMQKKTTEFQWLVVGNR